MPHFLRRRKVLAVLFVLISTIYMYWTYKSRAWIEQEVKIPHETFDSSGRTVALKDIGLYSQSIQAIGGAAGLYKLTKNGESMVAVAAKGKAIKISPATRLLQRLQKIEMNLLKDKLQKQPKVALVSSLNMTQGSASVYKAAFEGLGYKVALATDVADISVSKATRLNGLLCLAGEESTNSSSKCPMHFHDLLQEHSKVSPVPGLNKVLLRNDGFCYLVFASQHLKAQFKLFSKQTLKKTNQWTSKTCGAEATPMHKWGAVRTSTRKINEDSEDVVVQLLPDNVLLFADEPVVVCVLVLVTSASPLRLYRHREGGNAFIPRKIESDKNGWSMETFMKHLKNRYGQRIADAAVEHMDECIVRLFLLLEPSLVTFFESRGTKQPSFRGQQFFQLLQISIMFNSSLHPYILEVKNSEDNRVSQRTVQDTVGMLFSLIINTNVSYEVQQTLDVLRKQSPVTDKECQEIMGKCITDDFLQYLLESRWEADHLGNFTKLYPSHNGGELSNWVSSLSSLERGVENHFGPKTGRGSAELHDVLTAFEIQLRRDMNSLKRDNNPAVGKVVEATKASLKKPGEDASCNSDPESDPVLMELKTQPAITLQPLFKPDEFIYQATVPFDTMVLRIWGKASGCKSDVRVNSKSVDSQSSNHSLGVGWNKFAIFVVDTSQSKPEAVHTYSVYVFRQRRSEEEGPFMKESSHQVCSQLQECALKVFPNKSCGLHKLPEALWEIFLLHQEQLPHCENGHSPGRWVLPCDSCDDHMSCYWKEAIWAPYSCQYRMLSREQTRVCLAQKKILFVGDSTSRGIMYYLMEKLNGSLRKWEKTHAMKIYSDELNGSRTSVSFAYYPQFWLSENMKPVFVKALYQLIARFLPLENSTNTILVMGGVQWMWPYHLKETKKALASLGLNGIKVIVKSLGAGFFLPISGLPYQNLTRQRRTAQRNQQVVITGSGLGYEVVDTFGMTVSRYKEFLQGECGCHFHKVVDMRSLLKEADEVPSPLLEGDKRRGSTLLPRYHVIGPINSVYSELVINRMCS